MLAFALVGGTASSAKAETYETEKDTYQFPAEKVHRKILEVEYLTVLGITIGKQTLGDVQRKLGPAVVLKRREQAAKRICYVSSRNGDGTIVVFEAGAIGAWEEITAVTIFSRIAKFDERAKCTPSDAISKDTRTNDGLGLGLDRKSITQKLGTPTAEKNNNVLYVYRKEQRMTVEQIERMAKLWPTVKEHPFADVSSDVELVFIDGKTVAVTISKLETY